MCNDGCEIYIFIFDAVCMTSLWSSSYVFILDKSFMVVRISVYGFNVWRSVDGDRVLWVNVNDGRCFIYVSLLGVSVCRWLCIVFVCYMCFTVLILFSRVVL